MKFDEFFSAVDNLVREWAPDDPQAGATPRNALLRIYEDVREQAVHDLAVAVSQRDRATRTHGMIITLDKQSWLEKEGKRLEAAKQKGEKNGTQRRSKPRS